MQQPQSTSLHNVLLYSSNDPESTEQSPNPNQKIQSLDESLTVYLNLPFLANFYKLTGMSQTYYYYEVLLFFATCVLSIL